MFYFSLSVLLWRYLTDTFTLVEPHWSISTEKVSDSMVNTNSEHKVSATLKNWGVTISLDGIPKTIRVGDVTSKAIELTSRVSLAGLDLDTLLLVPTLRYTQLVSCKALLAA
ncbi:hypothetical protein EB796_004858 [Bugula neritina]|uniref:Uncharacterized protein n=1 Tax=Bugula neritina TaxID=10212 RepID=A0A7J7KG14_BUGNE|nr:hypothetical protein EB796_004858 [Bugula neritina]